MVVSCNGNCSGNRNLEKRCIVTKRVLCSCQKRLDDEIIGITLTDFNPANPTFPLTIVSARNLTPTGVIENLVTQPFGDNNCRLRLSGTVNVPLTVTYVDSANVSGTASAVLSVPFDVVLCSPRDAIIPYEIEATAGLYCTATIAAGSADISVSTCGVLIIRLVSEAELCVASYGFCQAPLCSEIGDAECACFLSLPLYPTVG